MPEDFFHIAFIGPGGPEIIVVMLVLIVMFGAKDAPKMFRKINEMLNQVRSTAEGFKREILYGDLNAASADEDDEPDGREYDYMDDYHDQDYDYIEEDEERDYSDETFRNLEKDLESADSEGVDESPEAVDEKDDAEKA